MRWAWDRDPSPHTAGKWSSLNLTPISDSRPARPLLCPSPCQHCLHGTCPLTLYSYVCVYDLCRPLDYKHGVEAGILPVSATALF